MITVLKINIGFCAAFSEENFEFSDNRHFTLVLRPSLPLIPEDSKIDAIQRSQKRANTFLRNTKVKTIGKLWSFMQNNIPKHESDIINVANKYRHILMKSKIPPISPDFNKPLYLARTIYEKLINHISTTPSGKALAYLGLAKISSRDNDEKKAKEYLGLSLKQNPKCPQSLRFKKIARKWKCLQ